MYHMRYVFTSFKRKEVIVLGHRKEAPDPRSRGNGSDLFRNFQHIPANGLNPLKSGQ